MTDAHTTADAPETPSQHIDPVALFESGDVTTETVEREADGEHFDRLAAIDGRVIVGVTNHAGELLLLRNDAPEGPGWVLPHGPVSEGDDWIETAVDWVDGLTGVVPELGDIVHVRRNDVTDGERRTTVYHVLFPGRPLDGETIESDVRYDCDDEWTAAWHANAPTTMDGAERDDALRFLG